MPQANKLIVVVFISVKRIDAFIAESKYKQQIKIENKCLIKGYERVQAPSATGWTENGLKPRNSSAPVDNYATMYKMEDGKFQSVRATFSKIMMGRIRRIQANVLRKFSTHR